MSQRAVLAAIGVVQGLAVWLLVEGWPHTHAARAACVGILTFVAVSAAVVHFAWTGAQAARLGLLAAATGAVYGAVAVWVGLGLPEAEAVSRADETRGFTWILASLVTLYVLGPFLQIFQRTGRLRFPYDALFLHSWNNFFVGLVGALFTGALWTVLLLWAALFDLIRVHVFAEIFEKSLFVDAATGGALGFGIALGRESERVVATLRGITLKLFGGLLPLVSFVAILFLAMLPVTGLEPLWDTDRASLLLMSWVTVTLLFFNAVYQEGGSAEPLPALPRRLVEAGLVAASVFLAIAASGLWLRIDQHGLTPTRMWAVLGWAILAAYAAGYTAAVLRRGAPWLPGVRTVNRAAAWLVVALGLLAHTPALDPLAWSARSQYRRLLHGRIDAARFDYGYLRFQLGRAGTDRFERLARLESHPEIDAIRAGVARARAVTSYAAWKAEGDRKRALADIEILAEGGVAPEGLLDAIRDRAELHGCDRPSGARCVLFRAEITGGPPEEWILAPASCSGHALRVFGADEAGRFVYRGRLEPACPVPESLDVAAAVRAGSVASVPAEDRDLVIEKKRLRFVPER